MRLAHVLFAVGLIAIVMTLFRDPFGRVFVIVFATGVGEVVLGLAALMALFQTVGALGQAEGLSDHAEALAATSVILAVASVTMSAWLFVGAWLVMVLTEI
jgi:hypothetical protein